MEPLCKGKKCTPPSGSGLLYSRASDPARTVVTDSTGKWLATFTDGAYTVTLSGATRSFAEPAHTSYTVTHGVWVRVLAAPFNGTVDEAWLKHSLADTSPDVLAFAMQYLHETPAVMAGELKIAGDADYGPLQADGTRQEGSDFNDYLGIPWTYSDVVDLPEADQLGALDCSGFIRMIWGYRSGLPLSHTPDGTGIPRRSFQMFDSAPGVVTIPNTGAQITDLSKLNVGDLVFFDASTDDGTRIDHVGMFIGKDSGGYHRFISSRKTANGPTMGDYGGRSILETIKGTGTYAKTFRAVRRL
jgi:cell wall-associated NlpC family hydrolase